MEPIITISVIFFTKQAKRQKQKNNAIFGALRKAKLLNRRRIWGNSTRSHRKAAGWKMFFHEGEQQEKKEENTRDQEE